MKRVLIILIGLLLTGYAHSQPVIKQAMNLDVGDHYSVVTFDDLIYPSAISEGANQTWDFSSLTTTMDPVSAICIPISDTPFGDSIEVKNANMVLKPYGIDADTMQLYQHYKVSADRVESMAMGMYDQYSEACHTYTKWLDPYIGIMLPMAYNDEFTDRYIDYIYYAPENNYILKDTSNIVVKAVGYGTLKTPAGVFNNVLLVKETVTWTWYNNYGFDYKTQGIDVNYHWYAPGIKIALMSACLVKDEGGIASYASATSFKKGGINNPIDDGNGNGGGGSGGGEVNYDPDGVWLNSMSSGGCCFVQNNGSLSWTMGESVIETYATTSKLTQGFNQPESIPVYAANIKKGGNITVYPNPFNGVLTIRNTVSDESLKVAIFSMVGIKLKEFNVEGVITNVDLSGLSSGMYCIKVIGQKEKKTLIVVKK